MNNIILTGMAGCGKSSVGVLAAKKLGYSFMDTDLVLQRREGRLLWQILSESGLDGFYRAEEEALKSVEASNTVIATGGSAVYYEAAMAHLKSLGTVVYMRLPFEEIESRIRNLATRGVNDPPRHLQRASAAIRKVRGRDDRLHRLAGAQRRPDRKSGRRQLIRMTQGQDIPAGSPDLVKCQSL